MKFIDQKIEDYVIEKSNTPSKVCDDLAKYTVENHKLSQMLCGPLESSLLGFLIHSVGVKRVLELGTFTGYSSLAMAEQLPEDGEVVTVDKNKKINSTAQKFWMQSEHGKKIKAVFGAGMEVIPKLTGKFDLVFIDADKANYLNYLKMTLDLLSEKGIIVVDNTLWSGRVVPGYEEVEEDKSTSHIEALNDFVANEAGLYGTLLPVRDGIFLIKKIGI